MAEIYYKRVYKHGLINSSIYELLSSLGYSSWEEVEAFKMATPIEPLYPFPWIEHEETYPGVKLKLPDRAIPCRRIGGDYYILDEEIEQSRDQFEANISMKLFKKYYYNKYRLKKEIYVKR